MGNSRGKNLDIWSDFVAILGVKRYMLEFCHYLDQPESAAQKHEGVLPLPSVRISKEFGAKIDRTAYL
jgi:hypothetical protein